MSNSSSPSLADQGLELDTAASPAEEHGKPKRRKLNQLKTVIEVPADKGTADKWSWRKYGQKPIKGSPYPRAYYRCSSAKGCPARKHVERSMRNSSMLTITYTAHHNHTTPATSSTHHNTTRTSRTTTSTNSPSKLTSRRLSSLYRQRPTQALNHGEQEDDDDDDEDDDDDNNQVDDVDSEGDGQQYDDIEDHVTSISNNKAGNRPSASPALRHRLPADSDNAAIDAAPAAAAPHTSAQSASSNHDTDHYNVMISDDQYIHSNFLYSGGVDQSYNSCSSNYKYNISSSTDHFHHHRSFVDHDQWQTQIADSYINYSGPYRLYYNSGWPPPGCSITSCSRAGAAEQDCIISTSAAAAPTASTSTSDDELFSELGMLPELASIFNKGIVDNIEQRTGPEEIRSISLTATPVPPAATAASAAAQRPSDSAAII